MSDVTMSLDGATLSVAADGVITGEHELVSLCNLEVARLCYTPNRQLSAVALLERLGAILVQDAAQMFTYLPDFDPFVWY